MLCRPSSVEANCTSIQSPHGLRGKRSCVCASVCVWGGHLLHAIVSMQTQVNYDDFALFMRPGDVADLYELLKSITPEEVKRRQAAMEQVRASV